MKMLNVGCGETFHKDWTNVDIYSSSEYVQEMDIRKGLEFANDSFDVVYSSHMLEHLTYEQATNFMSEMVRVLKPGGIIRIVVPNLETLAENYLKYKKIAEEESNILNIANYEWSVVELLDQLVREKSGGEMIPFMRNPKLPNRRHIESRFGWQATKIYEVLDEVKLQNKTGKPLYIFGAGSFGQDVKDLLKTYDIEIEGFIDNNSDLFGKVFDGKRVFGLNEIQKNSFIIIASTWWNEIEEQLQGIGLTSKNYIVYAKIAVNKKSEFDIKLEKIRNIIENELGVEYKKVFDIGLFRHSGEVHKWMYDNFSLKLLLEKLGVTNVKEVKCTDSLIPHFTNYNLDSFNDLVRKPDSLFMEGIKKD